MSCVALHSRMYFRCPAVCALLYCYSGNRCPCIAPCATCGAARESALGVSAEAALAGGINMMLSAGTTFMFKRAGMLSADGRCKALDKAGKCSGWAEWWKGRDHPSRHVGLQ